MVTIPPKDLAASKHLFTQGGKSRTVQPLVLADVRLVGASDREEVGKGAGNNWGDAQTHCAG